MDQYSDDRNKEGFGSFLDDFAINVFLPQIEEKVMQLISHATVGKCLLWVSWVDSCNSMTYTTIRYGCFSR